MERNNGTAEIGFSGLLTIGFIILKLCNVITWKWVWVLAPIWISIALFIFLFLVVLIFSLKEGDDR